MTINSENTEKKVHWTKRPGAKKKLAAMAKKGHRTRMKNGTARAGKKVELKPSVNAERIPQDTIAYALGYVECWIETFAKSAGVPAETLACELGTVLRGKNSG